MKKKAKNYTACAVLVAGVLMSNSSIYAESTRESKHWSYTHMEKLVSNNVFKGYEDGSLKPNNNMTRAEFISMINNMYGFKDKTTTNFKDLNDKAWYKNEVEIGKNKGYIDLISNDNFAGNQEITREEAVAILGYLLNNKDVNQTSFKDESSIKDIYKPFISGLSKSNFINGYEDGSFKPQGHIKRGEVASIVNKSIAKIYNQPGVYKDTVSGNVIINSKGVILENAKIDGDILIGGDLSSDAVKIKNSKVTGDVKLFSSNKDVLTLEDTNISEISLVNKDLLVKDKIKNTLTANTEKSEEKKEKSSSKSKSSSSRGGGSSSRDKTSSETTTEEPTPTTPTSPITPVTKSFVNKSDTKVMDIEGTLYFVLVLETGNISDYDFTIDGETIVMDRVNSSGTILKYELKNRSPFKFKLDNKNTTEELNIRF